MNEGTKHVVRIHINTWRHKVDMVYTHECMKLQTIQNIDPYYTHSWINPIMLNELSLGKLFTKYSYLLCFFIMKHATKK